MAALKTKKPQELEFNDALYEASDALKDLLILEETLLTAECVETPADLEHNLAEATNEAFELYEKLRKLSDGVRIVADKEK